MPDWATSDGAFLFYGALLAGIVGLATDWVRVWRRQSNLRKELAGIFSGTLATTAPSVEDIYGPIIGDDPPTATHYYLAGIDELLQPGVLDPRNEADLVLELMFLRGNVDSYNRNAELYNLAWVFGVDSKKLHGAKIDMYMSHKDLVEASDNLRSMIERVGPRISMPGEEPHTFVYRQKNKIRLWKRRRRLRMAGTTEGY